MARATSAQLSGQASPAVRTAQRSGQLSSAARPGPRPFPPYSKVGGCNFSVHFGSLGYVFRPVLDSGWSGSEVGFRCFFSYLFEYFLVGFSVTFFLRRGPFSVRVSPTFFSTFWIKKTIFFFYLKVAKIPRFLTWTNSTV